MIWTVIEISLSITASSFATLRPLLRAWRIKGFGSSGGSFAHPNGHARYIRSNDHQLASIRGHIHAALHNEISTDASGQGENRNGVTIVTSDDLSVNGSEDLIIAQGEIKVTMGAAGMETKT